VAHRVTGLAQYFGVLERDRLADRQHAQSVFAGKRIDQVVFSGSTLARRPC
jgi:hypothetical protein